MKTRGILIVLGLGVFAAWSARAEAPKPEEVKAGLLKAVATMHGKYARHGGYVWRYSPDGLLRMGEGQAGETAAWIQPPGTPAVGEAFLAAWEGTNDPQCKQAALDAAKSLVEGQLHSGGWYYRVEYEPELRKRHHYRVDGGKSPQASGPAGWETWKQRKNKGNQSMLDDDTSQSALRFLLRVEEEFGGESVEGLKDAVDYGLRMLIGVQYPVGAWSHNFDSFPDPGPSEEDYPIIEANYPESWPQTWPKAWEGCYHLNDNITTDCIRTLLLAHELRGDERALEAAKRGGEFFIRAQMPDPQSAWAQQYDKRMQPTWERKFEPPAITGGESQGAIEILMELYRVTKDERFLQPVPKALAYLKKSETVPGKLARYYELKTNKPLYFTKGYELTYDAGDVPDHYAFTVSSKVDRLAREFERVKAGREAKPAGRPSDARVAQILKSANEEGVWLEDGFVRDENGRKVAPEEGILSSGTFAENLRDLSAWLKAR